MMRREPSSPRFQNLALELVYVAKNWLVSLMQTTLDPPSSALNELVNYIPFAGRFKSTSDEAAQKTERAAELRDYLEEITKALSQQSSDTEQENLYNLKNELRETTDEEEKKLVFLLGLYDELDQLASEFTRYRPHSEEWRGKNDPRLKINKALMDYYEKQENLAEQVPGFLPAILDKKLDSREVAYVRREQQDLPRPFKKSSHKHPKTEQQSLPQALTPFSQTLLIQWPEEKAEEKPQEKLNWHNEEATLKKYKSAAESYAAHLLRAIQSEIEDTYLSNPNHSLFTLLPPRSSNTREELAEALLNIYYSPASAPTNRFSWQEQNLQNEALQIDIAIDTLPLAFHLAWKKYKLVHEMLEAETVSDFHALLKDENNRTLLRKRRDSAFMTFVKGCGLVVATILGLPLGVVGGAYLGYQHLFGAKATRGQRFLREADDITKEAIMKGPSSL